MLQYKVMNNLQHQHHSDHPALSTAPSTSSETKPLLGQVFMLHHLYQGALFDSQTFPPDKIISFEAKGSICILKTVTS